MDDKIIRITVTYEDSHQEDFPKELVDKLVRDQGDHKKIWGYIEDLHHQADIEYILSKDKEQHETELQQLKDSYKREKEESVTSQRAILKGKTLEGHLPCMKHLPYAQGEMMPVWRIVDYFCVRGLTNLNLQGLDFVDAQTGRNSHLLRGEKRLFANYIDSLNDPRIQFRLYSMHDDEDAFTLVNHRDHMR